MLKKCFILLILLVSFVSQAARPMVVYYESWSADAGAMDIQTLPLYVSHLVISFAKPNADYDRNLDISRSGLNLPYNGDTLKAAITAAHKRNPELKVLLAVGGATYHEWAALNSEALVKLVNDIGFDGIDIDYEQTPPDATLLNNVTEEMRQALPSDKLLTMAVMHVSAYGADQWVNSEPRGSEWTGFLHEIEPALALVSMINVMSYDAGVSYDVLEAYKAFRFYYPKTINMGMEVAPEAWGDHRWTVGLVESMTDEIKLNSNTDGMMLWSLHKTNSQVSDNDPAWPSANLLAKTACNELFLADELTCAQPLREEAVSTVTFRNDSWNANNIYFVLDASPYGYPRTSMIAIGSEATLDGYIMAYTLNLPVYVNALGFETACINPATGKPLVISWVPQGLKLKVNFWLDNKNVHLCSQS